MVTLLGSLIGFISAAFPDLLKIWRDAADRKHELTILEMQMAQAAQGHQQRLEEINAQADISESRALYKTYYSGIRWVDALNGTVRPVLAYSFFLLYFVIKCMQFAMVDLADPLPWQIAALWSVEDQVIFAGIISFYFGQRAMAKVRSGK
ncbi:MAG: hypothetical protein CMM93_08540 [Rickettsiales bacterium]|nr:hypothetical protein [Rickettsiales bacterium]|tara:strand:+ start:4042 stop:4491 length:450 start_codon:yes stop_codon:yes gene_type:complete